MAKEIKQIKALISEKTIVLKWKGEQINIQKAQSPEEYIRVEKMIQDNDIDALEKDFLNIKERIEKFTKGNFSVEKGALKLKGDNEALPECIAKKLLEMESQQVDFMPLIRFWRKLQGHPQPHVRQELYAFMLHNNIPLTELGDIVVEKGVRQHSTIPGKLVDCHSGSVDNSIGMVVSMPREKVNPDRNQTCSYGLHVAAPDYVRQFYSDKILIECIVDPRDFVSIPTDYNNTKARVCRYQVVGYAEKSPRKDLVVSLKDLLDNMPQQSVVKSVSEKVTAKQGQLAESVVTEQVAKNLIEGMSAKDIIAYVKKQTGKTIKTNVKNKNKIVKEAIEILRTTQIALPVQESTSSNQEKGTAKISPVANFKGLTAKEIQELVLKELNLEIGGKDPRKARILPQAVNAFIEAGWTVKGAY